MEFLQQLKQRRLFRIVVAYLAGGWLVLEVIDQVTQQGILPPFAYDLTLVWYISGIPLALVLGWFHGEKGRQRVARREVVLLFLFLAVGVAASVPVIADAMRLRGRRETASRSQLDLQRVAVLYFDDRSPGDSLRYLSDGFTEALIDEMAAVPALHVISRNGVAQFRETVLPPDSVARELGAGTLVEGSVNEEGGQIRISVSLLDGASGAEFQHAEFERPAGELLAARDELAAETSRLLRAWLGQEVELQQARVETRSVPAWAFYQRAARERKDAEEALEAHRGDAAIADFASADSLAARAALLDSAWDQPSVLQARIAFARAKIIAQSGDLEGAIPWIDGGMGNVARALAIEPDDPRAFEWRGSLEYLHFLLHVVPDPRREQALLTAAQQDLQRAVDLDHRLASAYAMLSHLYATSDDIASQVLAARKAYEEDAYLRNADRVVQTIFYGTYNLGQFARAGRWCDVGRRRFPNEAVFATCRLIVMTTPAARPDPTRAWKLVARVDSLAPARLAVFDHLQAELFAGGVLARAGLADSARRVMVRARDQSTPEVDEARQLHLLEGYLRTLVGDTTEALDQIALWAAANPGDSFTAGWWFDGLRGNPRFKRLVSQAVGSGTERGAGPGSR